MSDLKQRASSSSFVAMVSYSASLTGPGTLSQLLRRSERSCEVSRP